MTNKINGSMPSIMQGLLQINPNHMLKKNFGSRKSVCGLDMIREKFKNTAAQYSSEGNIPQGTNAMGDTNSTMFMYKEKARVRKSRFTATNLNEIIGSNGFIIKEMAPSDTKANNCQPTGALENIQEFVPMPKKNIQSKNRRRNSLGSSEFYQRDDDIALRSFLPLTRYIFNINNCC